MPKAKTKTQVIKAAARRTEAARLRAQAWTDFLGAIFS
jgi:hypothetical protein